MRNAPWLAIAALLVAPTAQAAIFTLDRDTVIAQGPIAAGDGAKLDVFLSDGQSNGHPIRTLVLSSPGGLVREGIAMADAVHAYRLNVVVPDGAECASACFLPFAAGERKTVGHDVKIGIHSATSTGGRGDDDGNATLTMARYAAQMGVPPAIIGRMVETDSINITWLSGAELRSMDVSIPTLPARRTINASQAKQPKFLDWLLDGASDTSGVEELGHRLPTTALVAIAPPSPLPRP